MNTRLRLPDTVNNPLSLVGVAIAAAAGLLFGVLLGLDAFGYLTNPYVGLLIFVAIPVVFLAGVSLIPVGAWRAARRRRLRPEAPDWPVLDLNQPRQRGVVAGVFALTLTSVVIVALASYGGVHYMESDAFCGQVCHTTMEPEFVAHQAWPHARVNCTSCHVGPGVGSFIESKLAGTRQLYHVVIDQVPRPIPTPVRALSDAARTCGQCHAPEHFRGSVLADVREYDDDEASTELVTELHLLVGGQAGGIHRHNSLNIEYVADPHRETMAVVRVTDPDGRVREFTSDEATPADIAGGERRRMDCLDCHNRAAHTFDGSPARAIDAAIASGDLSRQLPFIRREAVAAVSVEHADRDAAFAAIEERIERFYAAAPGANPRQVVEAVAAVQRAWSRNVFPAMRVGWGTYPNHIGHVDSPGCFRCHDDRLSTPDGQVISQDCALCHTLR